MENQTNEQQRPIGWRNTQINFNTPIGAVLDYFNILNQRLCEIEERVQITDNNGKILTLAEFYQKEMEAEQKQLQAQAQAQAKGE